VFAASVLSDLAAQGIDCPISFSIAASDFLSAGAASVMAAPLLPARPVRPMR
jgi:hypothetical protein